MRRALLLIVVAACADGAAIVAQAPVCGDLSNGHWDERMVLPGPAGVDARVNALLAVPDLGFVVGGSFDSVLGEPMYGVAVWNGVHWAPMGAGLPGSVVSLARGDDGGIWAAGQLTPDFTASYLARWDGHAWTMVTANVDSIAGVTAIGGGIAVYGSFARIGGIAANGLAVWDGAAWTARGLETASRVYTVAQTTDGLCAGGAIGLPGDVRSAACWNGSAWAPLGQSVGTVEVLSRAPDGHWWAGGEITAPLYPDTLAGGIARLDDDGAWQPVDGGVLTANAFDQTPRVSAIAFNGDEVIVGGPFPGVGAGPVVARGLARWSPSAGWTAFAPPGLELVTGFDSGVNAILRNGPRLVVGGAFAGVGGIAASNVASLSNEGVVTPWAGRSALAPSAGAIAVAAAHGRVLIAGPSRPIIATGLAPTTVAWFDGRWHGFARAGEPDDIRAAAVLPDGSPVVSGEFIARRDGDSWERLSDADTRDTPLLADVDGAIYFRVRDQAADRSTITRWRDGATADLGTLDGEILTLLAFDDRLIAVMRADDTGPARLFVRDPGGTWTPIPDAPPGPVAAATVSPALGVVLLIDGALTAWDGGAWRALPTYPATAIAGCDRGVVTAGEDLGFRDAAHWRVLDRAIGGGAAAIAVSGNGIEVVGGSGGQPGLRRWRAD
ncbi:MAG: hypothetical protein K8W52_42460 [Deltaproteobacteria bacterium]|nr:hypothetical protein [Deltaproteobacteria bacterium]